MFFFLDSFPFLTVLIPKLFSTQQNKIKQNPANKKIKLKRRNWTKTGLSSPPQTPALSFIELNLVWHKATSIGAPNENRTQLNKTRFATHCPKPMCFPRVKEESTLDIIKESFYYIQYCTFETTFFYRWTRPDCKLLSKMYGIFRQQEFIRISFLKLNRHGLSG